jgi:hypothetical protein
MANPPTSNGGRKNAGVSNPSKWSEAHFSYPSRSAMMTLQFLMKGLPKISTKTMVLRGNKGHTPSNEWLARRSGSMLAWQKVCMKKMSGVMAAGNKTAIEAP